MHVPVRVFRHTYEYSTYQHVCGQKQRCLFRGHVSTGPAGQKLHDPVSSIGCPCRYHLSLTVALSVPGSLVERGAPSHPQTLKQRGERVERDAGRGLALL